MKPTLIFNINRETHIPESVYNAVPLSGPADAAIAELMMDINVEVSLEDTLQYLKSTGGWTIEELQDLDTNISRLLWLACLDCQENETEYFYMGS